MKNILGKGDKGWLRKNIGAISTRILKRHKKEERPPSAVEVPEYIGVHPDIRDICSLGISCSFRDCNSSCSYYSGMCSAFSTMTKMTTIATLKNILRTRIKLQRYDYAKILLQRLRVVRQMPEKLSNGFTLKPLKDKNRGRKPNQKLFKV